MRDNKWEMRKKRLSPTFYTKRQLCLLRDYERLNAEKKTPPKHFTNALAPTTTSTRSLDSAASYLT